MSERDLISKTGVVSWADLANRRHVSPADTVVLDKSRIQGTIDFAEASFLERFAANPGRAVIRAEKERELLAAWEGEAGTLLRAPWRAGKTELVIAAIENAGLHDRFLFINSQDLPYPALRFRTADEFRKMYGVREVIDHVVAIHTRLGEEPNRDEVAQRLAAHIESGGSPLGFAGAVRRQHNLPPALVALDEIANYAFDPEKLEVLASFAAEEHVRLCFIVQKSPSIEPFYKVGFPQFRDVYLTPLTLAESARIVRAKSAEGNIHFTLHGIVEVHRAAGGRPIEVAALVDACRDAAEQGLHGSLYTRRDVARLTAGEIIPLTTTGVEPLLTNHIRIYERGITEPERQLVDRLTELPFGEEIDPALAPEVENLVRYGLAAVSHNRVFLNGELFRDAIVNRMTRYRDLNFCQPDEYGNDYI